MELQKYGFDIAMLFAKKMDDSITEDQKARRVYDKLMHSSRQNMYVHHVFIKFKNKNILLYLTAKQFDTNNNSILFLS